MASLQHSFRAYAELSTAGSSVCVTGSIGIVSQDVPLLSFILDGEDNGKLYMFDSERPHILYSSPPLQEGHHVLSLTLLTNASVLSIEGILIATNDVETGSPLHILWTRHRLGIIGIACGVPVLVLIVFLALFVFFRRRKRDVGGFLFIGLCVVSFMRTL
ncbi:hypothetical protein F5887DRAFT_666164 [Amanita rubescens]|nr:hypothetical protein F5887DRAFT_666164 [Amanita rubescens]